MWCCEWTIELMWCCEWTIELMQCCEWTIELMWCCEWTIELMWCCEWTIVFIRHLNWCDAVNGLLNWCDAVNGLLNWCDAVNGLLNCRQLELASLSCRAAVVQEISAWNGRSSGRPRSQNWCLLCTTASMNCMDRLKQVSVYSVSLWIVWTGWNRFLFTLCRCELYGPVETGFCLLCVAVNCMDRLKQVSVYSVSLWIVWTGWNRFLFTLCLWIVWTGWNRFLFTLCRCELYGLVETGFCLLCLSGFWYYCIGYIIWKFWIWGVLYYCLPNITHLGKVKCYKCYFAYQHACTTR